MKRSGRPITVGVDVGTTSVKALAVDEEGHVVARSKVPHTVLAPEPTSCATTPSGPGDPGPAKPSNRSPRNSKRTGAR